MSNRTMYSELAKNELLDEFYKASIERNALQARLDEAVKCLRGMFGDSPDVPRALDFLYTLENGGAK